MPGIVIKEALIPCPICKGKVELLDYTDAVYGFWDYEIKCSCGLRFRSESTCERIETEKGISNPKTAESKKRAYDKMVKDWNGMHFCGHGKRKEEKHV